MRSRLEAKVAATLDATYPGEWEYEPRAFANEKGQYLPDLGVGLAALGSDRVWRLSWRGP
jgi:hypothetical protein